MTEDSFNMPAYLGFPDLLDKEKMPMYLAAYKLAAMSQTEANNYARTLAAGNANALQALRALAEYIQTQDCFKPDLGLPMFSSCLRAIAAKNLFGEELSKYFQDTCSGDPKVFIVHISMPN